MHQRPTTRPNQQSTINSNRQDFWGFFPVCLEQNTAAVFRTWQKTTTTAVYTTHITTLYYVRMITTIYKEGIMRYNNTTIHDAFICKERQQTQTHTTRQFNPACTRQGRKSVRSCCVFSIGIDGHARVLCVVVAVCMNGCVYICVCIRWVR